MQLSFVLVAVAAGVVANLSTMPLVKINLWLQSGASVLCVSKTGPLPGGRRPSYNTEVTIGLVSGGLIFYRDLSIFYLEKGGTFI